GRDRQAQPDARADGGGTGGGAGSLFHATGRSGFCRVSFPRLAECRETPHRRMRRGESLGLFPAPLRARERAAQGDRRASGESRRARDGLPSRGAGGRRGAGVESVVLRRKCGDDTVGVRHRRNPRGDLVAAPLGRRDRGAPGPGRHRAGRGILDRTAAATTRHQPAGRPDRPTAAAESWHGPAGWPDHPTAAATTRHHPAGRPDRPTAAAESGHPRNLANSPVPTVLPALNLSLPANQLQFVTLHDGYAVRNSDGLRLGGAEAFQVRWSGVLLVECEGEYEFHAGAPTPEGEKPDFERAEKSSWRVTLERGQRKWVVLSHQWPGDTGHERSASRLRRGAYQIVVEFQQPPPDFTVESHVYPQHTGFQVKYAGPDSNGCLVALPVEHLYRDLQNQTLASGITFLPNSTYAQAFLSTFYTSTLRDMRCTYQRLLKAVLFAGRLRLCARPLAEDHQSELGYMLANPANFA